MTVRNAALATSAMRSPCAFCGVRSGEWQTRCFADRDPRANISSPGVAACPLCTLARHLERPRIDDEASLLWLPEMSQPAINTMMRVIHMQLRALGEGLHAEERFHRDKPVLHPLYNARATLASRVDSAASRLGSDAPSELGSALVRLSPGAYGRRAALLGGLRLLPSGRFYRDGEDVYPKIVDTWLELAKPAGQRARLPAAAGFPEALEP